MEVCNIVIDPLNEKTEEIFVAEVKFSNYL